MTHQRKIIVHIATSVDGYIARPDGDVEWLLNRPRTAGDYGMNVFFRSIDTILWGRKTYDFAIKHGGLGVGPRIKNYVFSNHPPQPPPAGVEFVNEPIADFVKRLHSEQGKNIFMMGGAGLIGSFLDAGEVDELIINVIPMLIGEGIPLAAPRHRNVSLTLKSTRKHSDGVVRLHYLVQRKTGGSAEGHASK